MGIYDRRKVCDNQSCFASTIQSSSIFVGIRASQILLQHSCQVAHSIGVATARILALGGDLRDYLNTNQSQIGESEEQYVEGHIVVGYPPQRALPRRGATLLRMAGTHWHPGGIH
jgi:hypothetical protein